MNLSEFEALLRNEPRLLKPKEVAALLGRSERTLRLWRAKGIGPAFVCVGPKFIKYKEPVVLGWRDQQLDLSDCAHCPTCGARVFHGVEGAPDGGRHEAR